MYYRYRYGRGFTYKGGHGKIIKDDDVRSWIKSLAIPPAWTEVEISEDPKAKLLATGRDAKGRKQYIYHPEFAEKQKSSRFNRIISFASQLETMRRVTGQHLRAKKKTRHKVLATMVRLLDHAYFRPGSSKYTAENNTFGLTTLRSKHLEIDKDELTFSYTGKSHKEQKRKVVSKRLAKIIKELDDIPGYRIFKYYDEEGNKHYVESDDLNDYIKEIMGDTYSAKDFRTWAGTLIAALALDKLGVSEVKDQHTMQKHIKEAVINVSELLGNTPSIARSSYIDPRVIDQYMDGKTVRFFKKEVNKILKDYEHLSPEELSVLCLLKENLK